MLRAPVELESLARAESQVSGDLSLIDCGICGDRIERQLMARRAECAAQGGHARVRIAALEARNGGLRRAYAVGQLGLGEAGLAPGSPNEGRGLAHAQ